MNLRPSADKNLRRLRRETQIEDSASKELVAANCSKDTTLSKTPAIFCGSRLRVRTYGLVGSGSLAASR